MNLFKVYQEALEKTYPSLTVFSDINWEEISQEYIASHDTRPSDLEEFLFNFPQFLQEKAASGDCPGYLYELAFFELMQDQTLSADVDFPSEKGVHLNPSLSFLNLEFDVSVMMDEAAKGNVQIIHRPHILCIYRHPLRGMNHVDISRPFLEVLQELEDGPLRSRSVLPDHQKKILDDLINIGLVVEV